MNFFLVKRPLPGKIKNEFIKHSRGFINVFVVITNNITPIDLASYDAKRMTQNENK